METNPQLTTEQWLEAIATSTVLTKLEAQMLQVRYAGLNVARAAEYFEVTRAEFRAAEVVAFGKLRAEVQAG